MSTQLKDPTEDLTGGRTCAEPILVFEDDKTRITQYILEPGQQTGWHIHEYDYVVMHQSAGELTSHFADGTSAVFTYKPGGASAYTAPVEHNAINTGDVTVSGFEIEYKK